MPFTISHAAAALPFKYLGKSRPPLAALMVGSMAPDFAYFFPLEFGRIETHSIAGVFWFSLPLGLAVWLYFVVLLERPTIAFLPDAWRTRITPSAPLTAGSMFKAAGAIVLGAFTHLIWDSFTHSSTPVVEALPGFRSPLFEDVGLAIPVYYVLQILSSALGLLALALWAYGIRKRRPVPRDECVPAFAPAVSDFERFLAVMFVGATACAAGFFKLALYGELPRSATLFVLLVGGMAGTALGWSILAVAVRFRSRRLKLFAHPDAD